ncbi:MAG: DUF3187 family protein [Desulfuromonadales bacterium]|nr:DUF3187 family protein [Desulfuromonadales bacterium]
MHWRLVLVLVGVWASSAAAAPIEIEPFYTRNQSPLVQIFGLPPAEGGELFAPGRTSAKLILDVANVFAKGTNENHEVRLDGEIYRLTLALRHGMGNRLELGLDLPYVWHTGGKLDGFIDGFHRTFGFPEGGRDQCARDEISYSSIADGEALLWMEEPSDGIGDLLLTAGYSLWRQAGMVGKRALALRGALKLPTGDSDDLTGSGSTDISLRLAYSDSISLASRSLSWYGILGGMLMSDGEVLQRKQENVVGFGTLGLGWTPYDWLALKVQFDGHSPFYQGSQLAQEDEYSVQIILGFTAALSADSHLDFGVVEDLIVETSPDVVFHLALGGRF